MNSKTSNEFEGAISSHSPSQGTFTAVDAAGVRRLASEARAICRVISLATAAVVDESIRLDGVQNARWEPSLEAACARLRQVRCILTETAGAPAQDWMTPLNLLEALAAAMWHCEGPASASDQLSCDELSACLRVAVQSLDGLLRECDGAANPAMRH